MIVRVCARTCTYVNRSRDVGARGVRHQHYARPPHHGPGWRGAGATFRRFLNVIATSVPLKLSRDSHTAPLSRTPPP
jgi:hypothetical protein